MTRLPLSYTPAFGVTGDEVENVLLRFRNIVKLDISAVVRVCDYRKRKISFFASSSISLFLCFIPSVCSSAPCFSFPLNISSVLTFVCFSSLHNSFPSGLFLR